MARVIRADDSFPDLRPGFPIFFSESLDIIEPAFRFLLYTATIPGRSHSPQTIRTYAENLLDFFDTLEHTGIDWRHVTKYTLAEYRNQMLHEPSPHTGRQYEISTINQRLRTIARFYEWAHQHGHIKKKPFCLVKVRVAAARQPLLAHTQADPRTVLANELTLPQNERLPHALSQSEQRLLLSNLKEPYHLMALWAIATGLRRKELCGLVVHQIPESFNLSQRDRSTVPVRISTTKGNTPRTIKVPILVLDGTHRFMTEERQQLIRACQRHDTSYSPPDHLFLNGNGQRVTLALATRKFSRAFRAAGIAGSLHSLRHTFAINTYKSLCRLARDNPDTINPLKDLQIRLGHSNIGTTALYLRSIDVQSCEIPDEIAFLYGDDVKDPPDPSAA